MNKSQITEMLALPAGEEQKFIAEKAAEGKPVEDMTVKALRAEIADYKAKLKKSESDNEDFKAKLEDNDKKLADVTQELETEKSAGALQLKWRYEEIAKLTEQNSAYKTENKNLTNENSAYKKENKNLSSELDEITKLKDEYRVSYEFQFTQSVRSATADK